MRIYKKVILSIALFCIFAGCKLGIEGNKRNPSRLNSMPVISRNVPSFASSGTSSNAKNGDYNSFWSTNGDLPAWLAYDLTEIDEDVKNNLLLNWMNGTHHFYSGNQYAVPGNYTIDVHEGDGTADVPSPDDPGWVTLFEIDNQFKARQHAISMADGNTVYNWLRLYITSVIREDEATSQVRLIMDIHDASLGLGDSWYFGGDSITVGSINPHQTTYFPNFPQLINQALDEHFPAITNAGISGWTTLDAVNNQIDWLADFPGRYVTLNYGTNDSGGLGANNDEEFYNYFEQLVTAVLDLDKIPVIPSIPCPLNGSSRIEEENLVIQQLKNDYPEIIDGPDLWTFFEDRPYLYDPGDRLHPSAGLGEYLYTRLWAETMLVNVYGQNPEPHDTEAPATVDSESIYVETVDDDSFILHWDEAYDNDRSYYLIYNESGDELLKGSVTNQGRFDGQEHGLYSVTIVTVDFAGNMSDPTQAYMFNF